MKENTIPQVAVITADNPEQLQEKMNAELRKHPEVINMTLSEGNGNRAIIQYEVTERVPEDEEDRYYLETGKRFCCNDCPECIWDPDRRAITHWCDFHKTRTKLKAPACEEFYHRLRSGNIHPVSSEERIARFNEMEQNEKDRRKEAKNHARQMYRLKRKAAAYYEELEEALSKDELKQPCYIIECLGALGNKAMLPHEIALIAHGTRTQLSEAQIISTAQKHHAAEVWRVSDPEWIDEESYTWNQYCCIWSSSTETDREEL